MNFFSFSSMFYLNRSIECLLFCLVAKNHCSMFSNRLLCLENFQQCNSSRSWLFDQATVNKSLTLLESSIVFKQWNINLFSTIRDDDQDKPIRKTSRQKQSPSRFACCSFSFSFSFCVCCQ